MTGALLCMTNAPRCLTIAAVSYEEVTSLWAELIADSNFW